MTHGKYSTWLIVLISAFCFQPSVSQAQSAVPADQITARIAELSDPQKNIPENAIVLSDELRGISVELDRYRSRFDNYDESVKALVPIQTNANKLIQDVMALDCDAATSTNVQSVVAALSELNESIYNLDPFPTASNPWASVKFEDSKNLPAKDLCQKLKEAFGDRAKTQVLLSYLENKRKDIETRKSQVAQLIEALQKRRAALSDNINKVSAQGDILNRLWLIILAIGLLSIGTIFVIKLFTPELQIEWVSSGQVIQFVTVMILLTVIMALGLASILKENTLGTLLGGIAGYVLSQGVGRAAASAVTRSLGLHGSGALTRVATISITSITPNRGVAAGGTPVIITGSGFLAGATVTFGGSIASITDLGITSISLTTPAHAVGSVDVVVRNSNGESATSTGGFTYE